MSVALSISFCSLSFTLLDPCPHASYRHAFHIKDGGDGLVIEMEVVLHDEEDILRGGEAAVLMFPLLPALRSQLGEVFH